MWKRNESLKSPLHPYIVFHMEVTAVKKWLYDIRDKEKPSKELFKEFLPQFAGLPYWTFYYELNRPNKEDNTPIGNRERLLRPTKEERILFLYFHMSLGMNKIAKLLDAGDNYVHKIVKNPRNLRHIPDNPGINELIKEWQLVRNKIPDEIFIKYL